MLQRKSLLAWLAAAALVVPLGALAQTTTSHNPYTVPGIQLRTNIVIPMETPTGVMNISMGAAVFQEIAPCRLMSTLEADAFPVPWGGPKLQANESRTISAAGSLSNALWINPCSGKVPVSAAAIAIRTNVTNGDGEGTLYAAATPWSAVGGLPIAKIHADQATLEEGGIMLRDQAFTLTAHAAGADLTVDIVGYFLEDPLHEQEMQAGAVGPTGPTGPQGDAGEAGPAGVQGEIGPQGAIGPTGPQGLQGPTGEQGVAGAQGPQGPQGLTGEAGAQGPQGLQGPVGATGAAGENGAIGPTGPQGPQGPQGLTGEAGAQGPQGVAGAVGPPGADGAAGPTGPTGPTGPAGAAGADGKSYLIAMGTGTFSSGTVRIYDASITVSSYVFLQYNHPGSPGNACSVESIGNGYVDVSGSTGKKFMYLVLTPYTP